MSSIIFFDGVCNLCNSAVQFTIERDRRKVFKFASLQSKFSTKELAQFAIVPQNNNSVILLENGKVYQQSTAALMVAKKLSGFWPLLYGFIIVPSFIRDAVYRFIGKNRYKWFGKQESCWVPTAELEDRFYT